MDESQPLRRAAVVVADLLGAVVVMLCIPLAILVIGVPLALAVRAVLWMAGML